MRGPHVTSGPGSACTGPDHRADEIASLPPDITRPAWAQAAIRPVEIIGGCGGVAVVPTEALCEKTGSKARTMPTIVSDPSDQRALDWIPVKALLIQPPVARPAAP